MKYCIFAFWAALTACGTLWARADAPEVRTFYIAPAGNDRAAGDAAHPVRTVGQAQRLARPWYGRAAVDFVFTDGVHYLDSCVVIGPEDGGTADCPVRYRAEHEGRAVVSGGRRLRLKWKAWRNGIWRARVVGGEADSIDQLYVNGRRKDMARYPNRREGKNVFGAWDLAHKVQPDTAADVLNPARVRRWSNPHGAYLHAMHASLWGDMHWRVTGVEDDGTLRRVGGWQNNRPSKMHPVYRMIENVFEELDAPGEWYYDAAGRWLYYYPEAYEDLKRATVEVVRLQQLFRLVGTEEKPVAHVSLEGLVFRHTARTFMENREPLLRSDWTLCRKGALTIAGAEDCAINACEFDQVGGNAVVVTGRNRRIACYGCYVHEAGANGFVFVGDPSAVRSPLFRYGRQNYAALDRTRGPLNDRYPADCSVRECLITRTGRVEKQTAPVQISMAYGVTVEHCSIYDVPRAGINISEGTFGGHTVRGCDVFDTVLETGDHGSFNAWGRDRYWTPDIGETARQVAADTTLVWLDMLAPNTICDSRWRCDHGWDIDLDDGSSHYRIYNNVLLNGGLKLREGYDRHVENNIILNNSLHAHVWYPQSGDVFVRNIVCGAYRPIGMNVAMGDTARWGRLIDYNWFVADDSERLRHAANGCDRHSGAGDPQFVDAEAGNYDVLPGSPVRAVGFRPFQTEQYGVTLPHLRRIARTPRLPELHAARAATTESAGIPWLGARIKTVETLGEQSAAGLKDRCGVRIVALTAASPLHKAGLRTGDVVLGIDGADVCTAAGLTEATNGRKAFRLTLWRNQERTEVSVALPDEAE